MRCTGLAGLGKLGSANVDLDYDLSAVTLGQIQLIFCQPESHVITYMKYCAWHRDQNLSHIKIAINEATPLQLQYELLH